MLFLAYKRDRNNGDEPNKETNERTKIESTRMAVRSVVINRAFVLPATVLGLVAMVRPAY